MNVYETLINDCDADIRAGHASRVARRLSALNASRVPRHYRASLAKICRRAALYRTGLTLLARVIYPNRKDALEPATPEEIAEYGILLLRNGSVNEALKTLSELNAELAPEKWLFEGYCHLATFEFEKSIIPFQTFIKQAEGPYALLMGRTNLGYALLGSGRFNEAIEILSAGADEARSGGHKLLLLTCLSLLAQAQLDCNDQTKAQQALKEALHQVEGTSLSDHLILLKTKASFETAQTHSLEPLMNYRKIALQKHLWNDVREADRLMLKAEFDQVRFLHLCYGTRYSGYREWVAREVRREPRKTDYILGSKVDPRFDIRDCKFAGSATLEPGGKPHQ
jgi:tetratricopeptide (TPR) repeat protein